MFIYSLISILGFPGLEWMGSDYKIAVRSSMREGKRVGMRQSLGALGATFLHTKPWTLGCLQMSFSEN